MKNDLVMKGSRARPMCAQKTAMRAASTTRSGQDRFDAATVSVRAQQLNTASPKTSTRPGRDRAGTRRPMTGTHARPIRGTSRRRTQFTRASHPPTTSPMAVAPWKAAAMRPT